MPRKSESAPVEKSPAEQLEAITTRLGAIQKEKKEQEEIIETSQDQIGLLGDPTKPVGETAVEGSEAEAGKELGSELLGKIEAADRTLTALSEEESKLREQLGALSLENIEIPASATNEPKKEKPASKTRKAPSSTTPKTPKKESGKAKSTAKTAQAPEPAPETPKAEPAPAAPAPKAEAAPRKKPQVVDLRDLKLETDPNIPSAPPLLPKIEFNALTDDQLKAREEAALQEAKKETSKKGDSLTEESLTGIESIEDLISLFDQHKSIKTGPRGQRLVMINPPAREALREIAADLKNLKESDGSKNKITSFYTANRPRMAVIFGLKIDTLTDSLKNIVESTEREAASKFVPQEKNAPAEKIKPLNEALDLNDIETTITQQRDQTNSQNKPVKTPQNKDKITREQLTPIGEIKTIVAGKKKSGGSGKTKSQPDY